MGAYSNPTQSGDYMRSVIPKGRFYPDLFSLEMQCSKDSIHPDLLKWADVCICMHNPPNAARKFQQPWLGNNWGAFKKHKVRVIWRSIGQSIGIVEKELATYRRDGLKIIRYSPKERNIPGYVGEDAMIRFAVDPDVYKGWYGDIERVVNITQSFKIRGEHVNFSAFEQATDRLARIVFGRENEDLGGLWGGLISYPELRHQLQQNRAFFYTGTQPASYTLSFTEAWVMGIPIVALGKSFHKLYNMDTYEVPDLIQNEIGRAHV